MENDDEYVPLKRHWRSNHWISSFRGNHNKERRHSGSDPYIQFLEPGSHYHSNKTGGSRNGWNYNQRITRTKEKRNTQLAPISTAKKTSISQDGRIATGTDAISNGHVIQNGRQTMPATRGSSESLSNVAITTSRKLYGQNLIQNGVKNLNNAISDQTTVEHTHLNHVNNKKLDQILEDNHLLSDNTEEVEYVWTMKNTSNTTVVKPSIHLHKAINNGKVPAKSEVDLPNKTTEEKCNKTTSLSTVMLWVWLFARRWARPVCWFVCLAGALIAIEMSVYLALVRGNYSQGVDERVMYATPDTVSNVTSTSTIAAKSITPLPTLPTRMADYNTIFINPGDYRLFSAKDDQENNITVYGDKDNLGNALDLHLITYQSSSNQKKLYILLDERSFLSKVIGQDEVISFQWTPDGMNVSGKVVAINGSVQTNFRYTLPTTRTQSRKKRMAMEAAKNYNNMRPATKINIMNTEINNQEAEINNENTKINKSTKTINEETINNKEKQINNKNTKINKEIQINNSKKTQRTKRQSPMVTQAKVRVELDSCKQTVTDAFIFSNVFTNYVFQYGEEESEPGYTWDEEIEIPGKAEPVLGSTSPIYSILLPVESAVELTSQQVICDSIHNILEKQCANMVLAVAAVNGACQSMRQALTFIDGLPEQEINDIVKVCEESIIVLKTLCGHDAVMSPNNGFSLTSCLNSRTSDLYDILQQPFLMKASAILEDGKVKAGATDLPIQLSPNLNVNYVIKTFVLDDFQVMSLAIDPANPGLRSSYRVMLNYGCSSSGSVHLYINGAQHYENAVKCNASLQFCELLVPGVTELGGTDRWTVRYKDISNIIRFVRRLVVTF